MRADEGVRAAVQGGLEEESRRWRQEKAGEDRWRQKKAGEGR